MFRVLAMIKVRKSRSVLMRIVILLHSREKRLVGQRSMRVWASHAKLQLEAIELDTIHENFSEAYQKHILPVSSVEYEISMIEVTDGFTDLDSNSQADLDLVTVFAQPSVYSTVMANGSTVARGSSFLAI